MTKIKKNHIEQGKELHKNQIIDEKNDKHKQQQEWSNLMDSTHKKLSEGALNISLTNRIRSNRGTKEASSKGHHKEGHAIHKGPHKKK